MSYRVTVLPQAICLNAEKGDSLLSVLRTAGLILDAPCGGSGTCGKCRVIVDGEAVHACQTRIDRNMTVELPQIGPAQIEIDTPAPAGTGQGTLALALDIGTTTVAGYLLRGSEELAVAAVTNPQTSFGADVVSRIRHAENGQQAALTARIRSCVSELVERMCQKAGARPEEIETVSLVGNPTMQQLYLGMGVSNLARPPFAARLTALQIVPAEAYLPICSQAKMLIVPDISGFVGADTVAAILASGMAEREEMTLLVDIGTNGEMVLGNRHRMVACAAAAGPALEGANICFGMRSQAGAIDHVWQEGDRFACSVIGGGKAVGICGSGLVDAVAAALNGDLLNARGRVQNEQRRIILTDEICLTQEDIRQVQLAKGAIAAGIAQMAAQLGICMEQIDRVCLAGAFGSYLDPRSACRIGLLPQGLLPKIEICGNAAGSGAKLLLQDQSMLAKLPQLVDTVEFLELAASTGFQRCFADSMRFTPSVEYWCQAAKAVGFTEAAVLDIATLQPREDVRAMCAEDKCGAYGKNWTCPPYCGTLEACAGKIQSYRRGILVQTVGQLKKTIDTRGYRRTEAQHLDRFHALAEAMRPVLPDALFLGAGGCRICPVCAYPAPCRFPDKACASMEGYGLFVTQVCQDNGLAYHHGEHTITYTACILF